MNAFILKNKHLVFVVLAVLAYANLGYWVSREQFLSLFFYYGLAFVSFYFLYTSTAFSEKKLFLLGISFRMILLFCLPFWSQDFYRFIWDGRLVFSGLSPYLFRPNDVIDTQPVFK